MKLATDLLEQADHLSRREPKKPKQASLRRSASTSYYALFHLLCAEAVSIMAPNVSDSSRAKIQRIIAHDAIKQVCYRFLDVPMSAQLAGLIEAPASANLRLVAFAFKQLQDARHSADCDLNSEWNRAKARQYVQMSRDAFAAWNPIRKQPEANIFLLAFFMLKPLESTR